MRKRSCLFILALPLILALGIDSVSAQEPFYKGKTIQFIVAYSPGGGFDTYTRAIARHFGKHVPGNPTVLVTNMTGAVGFIAANYLYNKAKPDGLSIGHFTGTLVLQHVLGYKAAEFDGRRFGWLGVPTTDNGVCALTKASGITSLAGWLNSREPVKLGGHGPGSVTSDTGRILEAAIGLPVRVIDGYKCTADIRLAAESGEVAGGCWGWESVKPTWAKGLESGNVRVIVQTTLKPHAELKDVPLAISYAKTREGRRLLEVLDYAYGTAFRTYAIPPGTPKDRVEILQKAFLDTLKDPEFLAEAKKAKLDVNPVDGPTTAKILASFYDLEPGIKATLRKLLIP